MSLTAPQNTLRYHLEGRPLTIHLDRSEVPVSEVVGALKDYEEKGSGMTMVYPETEALQFYFLNHAVAEVRKRVHMDEPLDPYNFVLDSYGSLVPEQAVRMFYYLLIICTRESRHVYRGDNLGNEIIKEFGTVCDDFNALISGGYSTHASQKLRDEPPECVLGTYVRSLQWIFYNGSFGGGYGGPAWGKVADCLVEFVYGRYTAEMMLDVGWTLAHNNGPIFNKGELYNDYSSGLQKVLDVQRSGQIPQLFNDAMSEPNNHSMAGFIPVGHAGVSLDTIKGLIGESFEGYVDWFVVEALGAMNSYHWEKSNQVKDHGQSEAVEELEKKAQAKQIAEQAVFNKNWFVVGVMNGNELLKVKKVTRKQLEAA